MLSKNDEIRELFSIVEIDWTRVRCIMDGGVSFEFNQEINPRDFLSFAKEDVQSADTRGLVNALSNSKRAIDYQVDIVLDCLGIPPGNAGRRKLELLNEIGIVAPGIIKKIRDARNLLEAV